MAASVTLIFVSSLDDRRSLLFDAISSVGRQPDSKPDAHAIGYVPVGYVRRHGRRLQRAQMET